MMVGVLKLIADYERPASSEQLRYPRLVHNLQRERQKIIIPDLIGLFAKQFGLRFGLKRWGVTALAGVATERRDDSVGE